MLLEAMRGRRGRRLLLLDLAVPRDVEPSAAKVNNIYLYDIDDLQQIAAENLKQRQAEIPRAEKIIEEALDRYLSWEASLEVVPTIMALRSRLEAIRKEGVQQYINKLPNLDEALNFLEYDYDRTRAHSPIIEKMGKVVIIESKSVGEYLRQLEEMGEDVREYDGIYGYSMGETQERMPIYEYPDYPYQVTAEMTNLRV